VTPITSYPARASRTAATDESTPPLMATTTLPPDPDEINFFTLDIIRCQ
jgi:hypothetical protein